jgi:hypothetical protein
MTKRLTKAEDSALGLLIVLGVVVACAAFIVQAVGITTVLAILAAVIIAIFWYKAMQRRKRLEYLRNKYHDEAIVQRILGHGFWEGQTAEQLVDSIGNPLSVDHKTFKATTRQIWKYDRRGANRYGLRITLDGGIVVGWDQKSW